MLFKLIKALILCCTSIAAFVHAEPLDYYFGKQSQYRLDIPTPESILKFNVGDRHVRHDQLMQYFDALANASDNVTLTDIGYTNEHRRQVVATVSSKANIANLDKILANRRATGKQDPNAPVVVWLGYSIHGNEISGANASMLVAYKLAAAISSDIDAILENVIVVIEPSLNPDGMDLFTTWVNSNRNQSFNTDPNHRTHIRQWPSGRTNHFMFDLNRDWLPLSQVESQNRVKNFHYYKPNVLADFHEMGRDGNYFFQPGVPSRNNPITPAKTIELTQLFATYHAKSLDEDNRLYYSEEGFDDFYYGKGSTYPDINAAVGILFEQASSRGFATDSANGELTFGFGIKNHVLTSFSTLTAAKENKDKLHQHRNEFYQSIDKLAGDEDFDGYLINEQHDSYRLDAFLALLNQHQIQAYPLTKTYQGDEEDYDQGTSYYIPLKQNQYRLIKTIFERVTSFRDNTFYDVSGWTLPLAYNINSVQIESSRSLKFTSTPWQPIEEKVISPTTPAYAYAFKWDNYLAPKMLNKLLNSGVKAKVATKQFSAKIGNKTENFSAGTIVIPQGLQQDDKWFNILTSIQKQVPIELTTIASGLTVQGIDLGSPSLKSLTPIKVLMMGGQGVTPNEAGHMLYYLDNTLNIPVSIIETSRLAKIDLSAYSHIIMVDGEYKTMPEGTSKRLKAWLEQGGSIYAQKRALKYLAAKNLLDASFASKSEINRLFSTHDLSYEDKSALAAQKLIAGTIFSTKLDLSHPLAYGYNEETLPIFKNSTVIIEQPSKPFVTVARFSNSPLLSGYAAPEMIDKVSGNAAIIAHNVGRGRIIASSSNLVFRGYWQGTAKIVANALFFSKAFSVTGKE
ncbi:M14 family zinc carboxypeptidase [Thalassotalea psychrophila]|uniref:M14 family zinc carboxypeptidase n=1 Tax=Thalassotalea psychrophila TaxID=3065647 RepID=A0ABY9TWF1_9GAMM|nr:M14 family zinc carboxypeptidase [Colwelliaceae bacterium SQ149]